MLMGLDPNVCFNSVELVGAKDVGQEAVTEAVTEVANTYKCCVANSSRWNGRGYGRRLRDCPQVEAEHESPTAMPRRMNRRAERTVRRVMSRAMALRNSHGEEKVKSFGGKHGHSRLARLLAGLTLAMAVAAPALHAADDTDDFDSYKLKVDGYWFLSYPSGSFQGMNETGTINLQRDVGFKAYSTFTGKLDWKFTRKNHIYIVGSSYDQTRSFTLNRTIMFQGQTFDVGLTARANLSAPLIAPGYQYDIIRRKRGHLGVGVQINTFDAHASINAAAQVTSDGVHHAAVSASGSLVAPIPVAGPQFRLYLTNSPRLYVEGNVYGMYLFGYGNFVSTADNLGLTLTKHLSVNAGYQLGSRLVVNSNSSANRIGIHLTQKGPIVGLEAWF